MSQTKDLYEYHQPSEDSEWSLLPPNQGVREEDYIDHEVLSDEDGERREELDLLFIDDLITYLDDTLHWASEGDHHLFLDNRI